MRYIGDVHGKFQKYLQLLDVERSIQLGDMGIGFRIPFPNVSVNHVFIRGNHDSKEECEEIKNWIPDGTFWEKESIFFVGGAWSIDWEWRQEFERQNGVQIWWPDEECSYSELQEIIDYYEICKPDIMVSHDCPTIMAIEFMSLHSIDKSKTRWALDSMFEIHKPNLWIFGHHHITTRKNISETEFICLDELKYIDIGE